MATIRIISSKSDAHRALIASGMGDGETEVLSRGTSKDIEATKACLAALEPDFPDVLEDGHHIFRCGESGSTFRFMLPVVAAKGVPAAFLQEGRLSNRPMSPLYEEMEKHGVTMSPPGTVPFLVDGQLTSGTYVIPGNVSSQFITGLLFALPILEGDSRIEIPGRLESSGYVKMTMNTISRFGIRFTVHPLTENPEDGMVIEIPGNQKYEGPETYMAEGDWSNVAFWLVAGILGEKKLTVTGLPPESAQGDRAILQVLQDFGGHIESEIREVPMLGEQKELVLTAYPSRDRLHGLQVSCEDIPDLVPVLALVASLAKGESEFRNAGRLRLKESDRLTSTATLLRGLGANVTELPEGLKITGVSELQGGDADGANDHRIVMTAAVASLVTKNPVRLHGPGAVAKSYPDFFTELADAGLMGNLELV